MSPLRPLPTAVLPLALPLLLAAAPLAAQAPAAPPPPLVTVRPRLILRTDANAFDQDDASRAQAGSLDALGELRTLRLGATGSVRVAGRAWTLALGLDYGGLGKGRGQDQFRIVDAALTVPAGRWIGGVAIGRQKEGVSLEMVTGTTAVTWMERGMAVTAFVPSRNTGVRVVNRTTDERVTWTAGWFNDFLDRHSSFKGGAGTFVGRVTALPWLTPDGRGLIHVGVSGRRTDYGGARGRFRSRPEADGAPYFADTDSLALRHATTVVLEAATIRGPVVAQAEWFRVNAGLSPQGDAAFGGGYGAVTVLLTGESRGYNRITGSLGFVVPKRPFGSGGPGAFEVGARYSRLDLDDGAVAGGTVDRWTVGVHWYATRAWRVSVNGGVVSLEAGGVTGRAGIVQARIQWDWQ